MKKLLIGLVSLLSVQLSQAQNFVPATLEKQDGSIVLGEVDYKDWHISPAKVEAVLEGVSKTLTPYNTKSITIENQKFVSAIVDLDISPFRKGSLLFGPERKIISDTTIFLKTLVEGKPSLFSHLDPSLKQHYFVQLANGEYLELIDQWYYNTDRTHTVNKPLYSGQIKAISVEYCQEMLSAADKVTFHHKSLTRFFTQLNQCQGITPSYAQAKEDGKFSLTVKGGVAVHHLKIKDVFQEFGITGKDAKAQDVSPTVGLALEYTMPWAHQRFIIGFDSYFNFKQNYYAKDPGNMEKIGEKEAYQVREKPLIEDHPTNNVLRFGLYGKYRLSEGMKNPWFISAGLNTDFITFNSRTNYYYYYASTSSSSGETMYYPIYREWYQPNALVLAGLNASLSKEFGSFIIEANAYVDQGYSRYDPHNTYKAYISGFSLRAGYKIVK